MKKYREQIREIIFEADTVAGKAFDIVILILILLSIVLVMLESIVPLNIKYESYFLVIEWIVTILFTIEYFSRIWSVNRPWKYIFSFYGIIDLLAILPTYIGIFITGTHSLMVVRSLRLLRMFRIFKLDRFVNSGSLLYRSIKESRHKITVFLFTVLMLMVIIGTLMYMIEGSESGFTNIPKSIYWAIVTMTTVGYGDISPQTGFGQFVASIVMILGYAIIAIPTGIISVGMIQSSKKTTTQVCPSCLQEGHDLDAEFCKYCGTKL